MNRRTFLGGLAASGIMAQSSAQLRADLASVLSDTQSRVVKLFGAGGLARLQSYGTGFLASPDGHVVTVLSHILDADVVNVVPLSGKRYLGKVLATDMDLDLAVLKIEEGGLPFFDVQKGIDASPGTRVLAYSNMFKVATGNEPVTVQRGVISSRARLTAKRGRFQAPYQGDVYFVDAVTNNPGAAGGVLTSLDGRLIGILGRELKDPLTQTLVNYAVPITRVASTVDAMIRGVFKPKDRFASDQMASSGVTALSLGIVLVPDVVARTPAYIDDVVPGSPAAQSGLQTEDLLVFLNSDLVPTIAAVKASLDRVLPGDDVQLTVRRGNDLVTVTVRVPEKKADEK